MIRRKRPVSRALRDAISLYLGLSEFAVVSQQLFDGREKCPAGSAL
jgi:hypothetical protein